MWLQCQISFSWTLKSMWMVTAAMKLRYLLLGRTAMTNLDSVLKSRDITLPAKVHVVKAMVFPLVMYGCESWTIKKADHQRTDAFELWCWRRLLAVPWTARRSNQSILKEGNPECPLEGLMLKLKLQYFGHLMWRADSLEETLMLGKIEGRRRRDDRGWDGWMASLAQWIWVWVNSGRHWKTEKSEVLQFMGLQRVPGDLVTEEQQYGSWNILWHWWSLGLERPFSEKVRELTFSNSVATAEFSEFATICYIKQHFNSSIFQDFK